MEGMSSLNVVIVSPVSRTPCRWTGSASEEGGELEMIDFSSPQGPPVFDYDQTGQKRKPKTFSLETKIVGADLAAQKAFIAEWARGTRIPSSDLAGTEPNIDYVIMSANTKHDAENKPSTLSIKMHEVGPRTANANGGSGGSA